MAKGDDLKYAKQGYNQAKDVGNRTEEARWANKIANILKNNGEYVEALVWLRRDYDITIKHLSIKHQIPTCQSLGEVHLRLQDYTEALKYQKKHYDLAKDENDLIEQQRATTQLGRTYQEIFLNSNGEEHGSVRNAKKYLKLAMELAKDLHNKKHTFVKEYIDAHNNIGLLDIDLDNFEEAEKILVKGLDICEEEEVQENDDTRSRLHHNLGKVYLELRKWGNAKTHIEKDISICNKIGHIEGEAKGYINLGELHYRNSLYNEAILFYRKALKLAKSLMDEDALVNQIKKNIEIVEEAMKIMKELQNEEQNLKRLARITEKARGTENEIKCLKQENKSLDILIEKSRLIYAWKQFRAYAKKKKNITKELCDQEKLSDSYLIIGEAYKNLRLFEDALKWYKKSWVIYEKIGNLEGQALVKINIGDVLDAKGDWSGALESFEEGYRIALQANRPSIQLSALENMHYSNMIRFDNLDKARNLQDLIDKLKNSDEIEQESQDLAMDHCSETESDNDNLSPQSNKSEIQSKVIKLNSSSSEDDDIPLKSLIHPNKKLKKRNKTVNSTFTPKPETTISRKRTRVIISDDEEEEENNTPIEDVATSDECEQRSKKRTPNNSQQDILPTISKGEESTSSQKLRSNKIFETEGKNVIFPNLDKAEDSGMSGLSLYTCGDDCQHIIFKIEQDLLHMKIDTFLLDDNFDLEKIQIEVACLYFLQLPVEKRSRGLAPVIQHFKYNGKVLDSLEVMKSIKDQIEVSFKAWVPKRMMRLYLESCEKLSSPPNMNVLKGLYNLEITEDEIIVPNCGLEDSSVEALFNAMHAHKTVSILDLSHNSLANGTPEMLKQAFTSSKESYGGLVLDLHCNLLGQLSLSQISESSMICARLEVLNISGNSLQDRCDKGLSNILQNSLYSLNIENCSIGTRTIQALADSLTSESQLTHLSIGYNDIKSVSIIYLLKKLSLSERMQELNLDGIKLNKSIYDSLCQFFKKSCLSGLMLKSTDTDTEGALQLTKSLANDTQEMLKLDLSYCKLKSNYIIGFNAEDSLISTMTELNLGGNPIKTESTSGIVSLLVNPKCSLKVLILEKCELGLNSILEIIQSLTENCYLEELNLAENVDIIDKNHVIVSDLESSNKGLTDNLEICGDYSNLEVADSEEEDQIVVPSSSVTSSSMYKKSVIEGNVFDELSLGINKAKRLKYLDVSDNGISQEVVEMLYMGWLNSREGCKKHVKDKIVHFLGYGKKCCKVKPCCRKY